MLDNFIIYDIIFLVLFTLCTAMFLYKRRHNLKRQGILYLYRTKLGIKFIEWTSRKFPRFLGVLQYFVVGSGYILMVGIVWLFIRFSYVYITSPIAAKTLKVPVLLPLVPYIPRIFNLDFLPPFYFTYWIIILAIVAIPHEFAHGIFARLNRIKIHSTGFGFLGPFLAAFVEPDEKQTEKAPKFAQLSILAAGTFSNLVFTVLFGVIFWLFFVSAFSPAGFIFNSYASDIIPVSNITEIDGVTIGNLNLSRGLLNKSNEEFTKIIYNNTKMYVSTKNLIYSIENNLNYVPVILDSPAFKARLPGTIIEMDGVKIKGINDLKKFMRSKSPGESVNIKTIDKNNEIKEDNLILEEKEGKAFLGVAVNVPKKKNLLGWFYTILSKIKNPNTYYESSLGGFGIYIYNLLWWGVIISISVALVNMLPLGIFDGGRFFYLTIWGITKNKKIGEKSFKASTIILLILLAAMMIKWVLIFI